MLDAYSKFYYGFVITLENCFVDFVEPSVGPDELVAEIPVGSYSPTDFCLALKTALDAEGANTYQVSFNRSTRKITVSADGDFDLPIATGSHAGSTPWEMMGFAFTDLSGSDSYLGTLAAGDEYSPQFKLQDYVDPEDFQEAVDASVNESADGTVEVVKFGDRRFIQMNIMFATNYEVGPRSVVRENPEGVEDLRRFMQFLRNKYPVEFMPDENEPSVYHKLILESTPESGKGTGYRLKEMYDQDAPGYFQTGNLKFRVVEA